MEKKVSTKPRYNIVPSHLNYPYRHMDLLLAVTDHAVGQCEKFPLASLADSLNEAIEGNSYLQGLKIVLMPATKRIKIKAGFKTLVTIYRS